jgi:S1-C subfamily serine protease
MGMAVRATTLAALVTLISGVGAAQATEIFSGSGVLIGAKGEILTNAHVVEACQTIIVKLASGDSETGALVARDESNDLAVVRVTGTDNPPTPIASFREGPALRAGDQIVVLGYPLSGVLATEANVSVGNVNALAGIADDSRYVQISAPVQPGNSGGPLLDASGHLVGIVTAKLDALRVARFTGDIPQNVNFALKTEVARAFLDSKGIAYQTARSDRQLSVADVGSIARPFTVRVECEQADSRSEVAPAVASPLGPSRTDATSEQTDKMRVEQTNQCIDPASSLDQTIKACTATIEWINAAAASGALDDPSGENNRFGKALFYKYRGSAYHQKGEYDLAIADFTDAIHLNPIDGDAYYDRGEAYDDKHDYERAISDFNTAIVAGSATTGVSAALRLGFIYTDTRKYDQAMHWFLVAADKGNTNAMGMIAVLYGSRIVPDCDSALIWIKKAIVAGDQHAKEELRSGFDGRCHWQK